MKNKHPELYEKITDPFVFRQDKWYKMPRSGDMKDFIEWYYHTGCLEFSSDKGHFRVVAYPVRSVVPDSLLNKNEVKVVVPDSDRIRPELPLYVRKEGIKGYDDNEERIQRIMKQWISDQTASMKDHEKKMEFLKKKRSFFE